MDIESKLEAAILRYILIPLYRVASRLTLNNYKIALNTESLLMRFMRQLIRESDVLSGIAEDKIDLFVVTLVTRILVPELFLENHTHRVSAEGFVTDETLAEVRSTMDENSELVQSLESQLLDIPLIIECLVHFWLTVHLRCSISKDLEYAGYNISRAQQLDSSAKALTIWDLRSVRRNAKRNIKRLKKVIIDRESDKFDIKASEITKYISFIAVLFMPSGYLYNYFLLGSFGIDSAHYFTIPDYVASSVTALRESIVPVLSFVFGVVCSRLRVSKEHVRKVLASRHRMSIRVSKPPDSSFGWHILLISIVLSIAFCLVELSLFYISLGLCFTSIIVQIVDRYVFRYFKRPIPIRSVIIAIAIFGISMWSSASSRVFEVRKGIEHDGKNYTVYFEQEHSLHSSDPVILTSTSEYYILITRDLRAYVVEKESIKHIEIKTDQHWFREIFPIH